MVIADEIKKTCLTSRSKEKSKFHFFLAKVSAV